MTNDDRDIVVGLARAILTLTKATAHIAQKTVGGDDESIASINETLKHLNAVAESIDKKWIVSEDAK